MTGAIVQRLLPVLTFYGVVALAASAPSGSLVDTYVIVIGVREAPASSALPGIHLEAKIDGRVNDIYLAPAHFLEEYGMIFKEGDDVHITGTRLKVAGVDVVLVREVAVGASGKKTLYLRDDNGPFWKERVAPGRN